MLPSLQEAEKLLEWAGRQTPGPWTAHSRAVARAAKTIACACGMDGGKAAVFGLLHDIGRYEGPSELRHIAAGYELLMKKGWDEPARICLTHSFPVPELEAYGGRRDDVTPEQLALIREILATAEFDDYDKLVQLCDALATAKGVCLLEVRLVDVCRRHGFNARTGDKWEANFALKQYFDKKCGRNVYTLFGDEVCRVSVEGV